MTKDRKINDMYLDYFVIKKLEEEEGNKVYIIEHYEDDYAILISNQRSDEEENGEKKYLEYKCFWKHAIKLRDYRREKEYNEYNAPIYQFGWIINDNATAPENFCEWNKPIIMHRPSFYFLLMQNDKLKGLLNDLLTEYYDY